jgi:lactate permease
MAEPPGEATFPWPREKEVINPCLPKYLTLLAGFFCESIRGFYLYSDTSSNALFAALQKTTAQQIGVDPTLMVAANSSGGVVGKMISPQSIAVATAATGMVGEEGSIFRFALKHSVAMVLIISLITLLQAYVLKFMLP